MWHKFLTRPYVWWLIIALVIILAVIGLLWLPSIQRSVQQRRWLQPFIDDANNSLGGDSPQAAYQQFWQALQNNQRDTALAYIIGLRRDYYQRAWQDPQLWQLDQSLPQQVSSVFQGDCLPEAVACQQRATLIYTTDNGRDGRLEMYQNLAGRWQIGDIY